MNTVAIVAHYNEESVFSQAFLDIINVIGRNVNEIVIISTSKFERLPPQLNSNNIHVYYRPNFGYDFYSYKLGLELLGLKNLHNFGVLLLNSSFSISDPNKFEKAISRALGKSGNQVIGLTLSNQIARHLQSFFLFFPQGAFKNEALREFFSTISPQSSKFEVIQKYEVGLSQILSREGFKLYSLYRPKLFTWLAKLPKWNSVLIDDAKIPFAKKIFLLPKHAISINWPILATNEVSEALGIRKNNLLGLEVLGPTAAAPKLIKSLNWNRVQVHKPQICVVIHAYYLDGLIQIFRKLDSLCQPFDVIITSPFEGYLPQILEMRPRLAVNFKAHFYPNQGRDIGPFLDLYKSGELNDYLVCLKLHTKKSKYSSLGEVWNTQLLESLLGSSARVSEIIREISDGHFGIVGPKSNFLTDPKYWGANRAQVLSLRRLLKVKPKEYELGFFAGSMFWFNPKALAKLNQIPLTLSEFYFPLEKNQIDGTLAHALERIFCDLSIDQGYELASAEEPLVELNIDSAAKNKVIVEGDYK